MNRMVVKTPKSNIQLLAGLLLVAEAVQIWMYCLYRDGNEGKTAFQRWPLFIVSWLLIITVIFVLLFGSNHKTLVFSEAGCAIHYLFFFHRLLPWEKLRAVAVRPGIFSSIFSGYGVLFYTGRKRLFRPFDASMYCTLHPLSRCYVLFEPESKRDLHPHFVVQKDAFLHLLTEWDVKVEGLDTQLLPEEEQARKRY